MSIEVAAALAASMVKAELEKSGKIPKIEHGKELGVLKWDGDTTGLEYLEAYGLFRISDTPIPTETIKGIKILVHDESMIIVDENGYTVISSSGESATNPNVTLQVSEYGPIHFVCDTTNSMLYAMSVTDDYTDDETGLTIPKGFYLLCSENGYVSEVNGVMMETETIHPIDQKYLPGVCLPLVIDLAQYESDGSTLGEVLQSAIDQSINGTPTMAVIKDTNCALQNALNSAQDRQVLLKITYTYLDDAAPAYAYVPVTIFRYPSGDHAMSLSAKIAVVKNASVYDLSVGLMFPYVKNEGINLACLAKSLL